VGVVFEGAGGDWRPLCVFFCNALCGWLEVIWEEIRVGIATFRAIHFNFSSWPLRILAINIGGTPGSPLWHEFVKTTPNKKRKSHTPLPTGHPNVSLLFPISSENPSSDPCGPVKTSKWLLVTSKVTSSLHLILRLSSTEQNWQWLAQVHS